MGKEKKSNKWYLGGVAGCLAVAITHPLDLLKVHLQTQNGREHGLIGMSKNVIKNNGMLALYNGISASILRQATYTTTRFGLYELAVSQNTPPGGSLPFSDKICICATTGFIGGLVGNPADKVNVIMQNDVKLALSRRKNFNNVFDGIFKIYRQEGFLGLMSGCQFTAIRGSMMTIGQIACYDWFKNLFVRHKIYNDNVYCHLTSSLLSSMTAVLLTQPLDVIKTNLMNNHQSNNTSVIRTLSKNGITSFYKGLLPAFMRLAPHTVLLFVILEQLKKIVK